MSCKCCSENTMTDEGNNKKRFLNCKACGYQFARLLNDNTVLLYGKKGEQFTVNFARVHVTCPNPECGLVQIIESPLVSEVTEMIKKIDGVDIGDDLAKSRLRMKTDFKVQGIRSIDELHKTFPPDDIKFDPVWTKRFANLLPPQQKTVYRIMIENFRGRTWDPEMVKVIQRELNLPEKEASELYETVLRKIGRVKGYKVNSDKFLDVLKYRWWNDSY